jgi:hypothetical protein
MAINVYILTGMEKSIQASRLVNNNSNALANVFNIDVIDLRNKDVTSPTAALFKIINKMSISFPEKINCKVLKNLSIADNVVC